MREVVILVLGFLAFYAGVGVVVALWLVGRGLGRVDAAARSALWSFRVLVFPGMVGLWPLMLWRARGAKRGKGAPTTRDLRAQRRAHLAFWLVLTPLLLGTVAALAARRDAPAGARP